MKILTGQLKGRTLPLKPSGDLRPTSDKVRKAIFDILQGALEGKRVLDLFSGTGALGFEALSSGAKEVIWVEADRAQAQLIQKTASVFGFQKSSQIIQSDALEAIKDLDKQGESFNLIFLDPPYHKGWGLKAVKLIANSNLIHQGSIIILETHKTEDPPEEIGNLKSVKTKKHGDTKITFYRPLEALSPRPYC